MKPKNKLQQQVFELSKKLPPISNVQVKWAYQNCMKPIGRRTVNGVVSCLECGHSWTDARTEKHCTCPHCGTKLQIADTRQRVFREYEYFCVVTACGGFQVLRFFYIQSYAKVGQKAHYDCSEVVQRWIAPDGKPTTIARLRPMTCFSDTWNFCSKLEIRPDRSWYNIIPTCIYPRQRLIPELKRCGFKGDFYQLTPFDLFHVLLTDNRAETLLKAGQTQLLQFFAGNGFKYLNYYWAPIKICIRNRYKVEDVSMWCDYIELLHFFGKDLHNAKYVCPTDLAAEHDKYVKKKTERQERESRERVREKALEDEYPFCLCRGEADRNR